MPYKFEYYDSSPEHLEPFIYQPLDPRSRSIRLLRLLKSPRNWKGFDSRVGRIKCKFEITYVGSGRTLYDAVSYHWDRSPLNRFIELSGKAFKISAVVEDILLRLRDGKQDRLLWIDSICINQKSAEEKSNQIGRMREIFSEAQTVICSLGPHNIPNIKSSQYMISRPSFGVDNDEDRRRRKVDSQVIYGSKQLDFQHDAHKAMKIVTSLFRRFNSIANVRLSGDDEEYLLVLFNSYWFERVWVVQEVAVASNLRIICGTKEIDGRRFAKLINRLKDRVRGDALRARLRDLQPFLDYMAGDWVESGTKPELLDLLQRFRPWKATEAPDKVFALLGLAVDGRDSPLLAPDNSLSVEVIYQRVARYMMLRYGSLAILTHAIQSRRQPLDPTEVPDWYSTQQYVVHMSYWNPGAGILPSWCPDWRIRYVVPRPPEPTISPRSLPSSRDAVERELASYPDIDSEILRVPGDTFAVVSSAERGVIAITLTSHVAQQTEDRDTIVKTLTSHCESVSPLLAASAAKCIYQNDQLCILEGCTGIAVLRPQREQFSIVLLEHSDFTPLRLGSSEFSPIFQPRSGFGETIGALYGPADVTSGGESGFEVPMQMYEII